MLYLYRIVQDDGSINHHGIVSASNEESLFWTLDEFVDPYSVELKKIRFPFSICFDTHTEKNEDFEDEEYQDIVFENPEISVNIVDAIEDEDQSKWFRPKFENI